MLRDAPAASGVRDRLRKRLLDVWRSLNDPFRRAGETKGERQRAYAYARKHLLMFDSEVNRTKERLAYFADTAGYELAATFIEEIDTWPAAFERLLHAVIRDKVETVILPQPLALRSPWLAKGH